MSLLSLVDVEGDTEALSKYPAGLEIAYSPAWQRMPDSHNASSPNEYFNASQT